MMVRFLSGAKAKNITMFYTSESIVDTLTKETTGDNFVSQEK